MDAILYSALIVNNSHWGTKNVTLLGSVESIAHDDFLRGSTETQLQENKML